jgi:hypothetical protein
MSSPSVSRPSFSRWPGVLTLLAVVAFLDSVFEYFWPANGIHGTEGAVLVVISTLLMAIASALIAARAAKGWFYILLEILVFLDLWGTGVAAYFLENWILLVLDFLALIVFVIHVAMPRRAVVAESVS